MFREKFPRLYELKDRTPDPESPSAYFKDFEIKLKTSPLAWAWFTCLERKLQYLPQREWTALQEEAFRYLMVEDADRGWAQLFDILCEVDAFIHLMECGCSDIHFIPRAPKKGNKTPDLEGLLGSQRVLCEVKRINISEAESIARRDCSGGMYERDLSSGFFGKLQSSIAQAKDQICAYDPNDQARRIVYIAISFDEGAG